MHIVHINSRIRFLNCMHIFHLFALFMFHMHLLPDGAEFGGSMLKTGRTCSRTTPETDFLPWRATLRRSRVVRQRSRWPNRGIAGETRPKAASTAARDRGPSGVEPTAPRRGALKIGRRFSAGTGVWTFSRRNQC